MFQKITLPVGLTGIAVLCAAIDWGGTANRVFWNISLLILGVAGIPVARSLRLVECTARFERLIFWAVPLVLAYAGLQLLPLPLAVLDVVSPQRALLARNVETVVQGTGFASISVGWQTGLLHVLRFMSYAIVFLIVWLISRRVRERHWVVTAPLLLIGGFEATWALFQAGVGSDVTGSYGSRDHLGGLLEMVLPFGVAYAMLLMPPSGRRSLSTTAALKCGCAISLAAAIYAATFYSYSRMAVISTHLSLFVMGSIAVGARVRSGRKWPAIAGVGALVVVAFLTLAPSGLVARYAGLAGEDPDSRWLIWKDTLRLIRSYPLVGVGLGNFFPAILKYQTSTLNAAWLNAHNDYLQLISELGVAGFAILATMVLAVLVVAVDSAVSGATREMRYLGLACVGGIVALLAHSVADFNLYIPANAMVFAWIAGVATGLPALSKDAEHAGWRKVVPARSVMLGCAAVMTAYSIGWLIFLQSFASNASAEAVFCRVGICDSFAAEQALQRKHGVTSIGDLAPAEVGRFLQRDAAGPYNWCDMGDALMNAGQRREAEYCYGRAVSLGPRIPYMLYRAANFKFGLGNNGEAVQLMSRAVEGDSNYIPAALDAYEKNHVSTDDVLRDGLPNSGAGLAYLRQLLSEGPDEKSTRTVWESLLRKGWVDDALASEYAQGLINRKQPASASQAWAEYEGSRCPGYLESTYVCNGGFELNPTRSPFDWRIAERPGVTVSVDEHLSYAGHKSARINFDGTENVKESLMSQSAYLPPGRYTFRARMKSDGLTTNQGPLFEIVGKGLHVATEQVTGSTTWHVIEATFDVPADAGLLDVRLTRNESLKFDNKIKGTVWVDDVAIVPSEQGLGTRD